MIQIKQLKKVYRTDEVETVALNAINLMVEKGECVAIMSPSGCGKTTLMNILGILDEPDSGSFIFNGIEISHFSESQRVQLRKQNIGFVFQNFN
jgi:putative ABC transport system ATP-binding protein